MFKSAYLIDTYASLQKRYHDQPEYLQAVEEFLTSLDLVVDKDPRIKRNAIIERMVEPERMIKFRVSWVDDSGNVQVNRAMRVQFNSAIGPYKGGIRFHHSVNESIMKFLAFEQTFKNSLTCLPMGGAKGGSDFDPAGKSDNEIMRFCQGFILEMYRHIGPRMDVPAGDLGVGAKEIGYMYGMYKRIENEFSGTFTSKGIESGGSLGRAEATGYGLCYFVEEMLKTLKNDSFANKKVAVSGSGNVAIYAIEKIYQLKGLPVTASDSDGFIYDPNGINLEILKKLKEVDRKRISDYEKMVKGSVYYPSMRPWAIPCDIALPCATQNELDIEDAKILVSNNVIAVAEGANMPCTPEATQYFQHNNVLFGPAKAANAGGVATSGLEMSQNSVRYSWSFEKVDEKLKAIMKGIFNNANDTAKAYGVEGDLVAGANMAGFIKVADAMIAQGVIY